MNLVYAFNRTKPEATRLRASEAADPTEERPVATVNPSGDYRRYLYSPPLIHLDGVSAQYAPGPPVLSGVSLKIYPQEFVFVVGPTGAGKSTFLKLLFGESRPSSGSVRVGEWDLTGLSAKRIPEVRRHIGVVFQDYQLLPDRSVFENVAFTLHVIGIPRREIAPRAAAALERVGLMGRMDAHPHELSGGEQQRVCIARALVTDPLLLLCDEPTGNLDPTTSWEIMRLLETLNERGTTVLVATHDRAVVDRFRRRVLTFSGGKLVRDAERSGYFDPKAPSFLEPAPKAASEEASVNELLQPEGPRVR